MTTQEACRIKYLYLFVQPNIALFVMAVAFGLFGLPVEYSKACFRRNCALAILKTESSARLRLSQLVTIFKF
jgi:hypothetical protein